MIEPKHIAEAIQYRFIMEDEGLTAALTHDRHFAQAGVQTLLR
jgi:hypothetical protein